MGIRIHNTGPKTFMCYLLGFIHFFFKFKLLTDTLFIYLFIYSFIYSLTYSFIYSFIYLHFLHLSGQDRWTVRAACSPARSAASSSSSSGRSSSFPRQGWKKPGFLFKKNPAQWLFLGFFFFFFFGFLGF